MPSPIHINIDATGLSNSGCILALKWVVVDGYKSPISTDSLSYGVALHKYTDIMVKTGGYIPLARDEALKAFRVPKISGAKKEYLSNEKHLLTTCYRYWEEFINKDVSFEYLMINNKCFSCGDIPAPDCQWCKGKGEMVQPASELTFSIPYYSDGVYQINVCGTIDKLGKIKGGCYCIGDNKTTSGWDTKDYFKQYELSRQLRMYNLSLKLMSVLYPDSILGQIGKTNIGAFIDAIFLKPEAIAVAFSRSEMQFFRPEDMDGFRWSLDSLCKKLVWHLKENNFPQEGVITGACERKFGKCQFWNICAAHPMHRDTILNRDFKKVLYNPLAFNE